MLELTSTTFIIDGLKIYHSYSYLNTQAIDRFLISALLKTKIEIKGLEIYNSTNPSIFMLSSTMSLKDSLIH